MERRSKEELANVVTHGVGMVAALAAAAALVIFASVRGDVWEIVGVSVFATTLVALYTACVWFRGLKRRHPDSFLQYI